MLEDLRITIAESMEALAQSRFPRGTLSKKRTREFYLLREGAETLRWCAEFEQPTTDLLEQIKRLTAEAEEADEAHEALINGIRETVNDWQHTDTCPDGQPEATADTPCHCDLKLRRDAVLYAVRP